MAQTSPWTEELSDNNLVIKGKRHFDLTKRVFGHNSRIHTNVKQERIIRTFSKVNCMFCKNILALVGKDNNSTLDVFRAEFYLQMNPNKTLVVRKNPKTTDLLLQLEMMMMEVMKMVFIVFSDVPSSFNFLSMISSCIHT